MLILLVDKLNGLRLSEITTGAFKLCNSPLNWRSDYVVCITPLSVNIGKKLLDICQIPHVFEVNSGVNSKNVSATYLSEYYF